MENAEEVFQFLEEFTKRRPKVIPRELEDYLNFVATTGDPIYQWSLVKNLFKEKLLSVITEFYETSPGLDIPHCPNVDLFSYETMKNNLLEKIDAFPSAPFTIQRISELLTAPRKQYNRIDKFMRAFEKNILVVSTRDPGQLRHTESENGEAAESMVNGSDSNSEYNVDVEMEDISTWKENPENVHGYAVQSGSSAANRTQPESDTVHYTSQNGPAAIRPASQVELMTIEADTNISSIVEDLPESSSTSDSDLSPPELDSKQNDDSDSDKSDTSPVSSVITVLPAESVNSPTADSQPEKDKESTTSEKLTDSESSITTSEAVVTEHKTIKEVPILEATASPIDSDDSSVQETEDKENTSPSPLSVSSPDTDDDKCTDSDNVTESSPAGRNIDPDQLPDTSSVKTTVVLKDTTVAENSMIDECDAVDSLKKEEMDTSEVIPSPEPSVVTTPDDTVSDISKSSKEEPADLKVVDSTEDYPSKSLGDVEDMKSADTPSPPESSPVESLCEPMAETCSVPVDSSAGVGSPRVAENLPESTSDDSNNDSEMSSTEDSNSTVISNSYTALADPADSMVVDIDATSAATNSSPTSNSPPDTIASDPSIVNAVETSPALPDKLESSSTPAAIVSSQTDDAASS